MVNRVPYYKPYYCRICGEMIHGYGNNGRPVIEGVVCDKCHRKYVIPARLREIQREDRDVIEDFFKGV